MSERESVEQLAEDLWHASQFDFVALDSVMPGQARYETFLAIIKRWCVLNGLDELAKSKSDDLDICRWDELHAMAVDAVRAFHGRNAQRATMKASPTAPQPEVAVSERDRELAWKLKEYVKQYPNFLIGDAIKIIANHLATEREAFHDSVMCIGKLKIQLAETEAKLKEAEELIATMNNDARWIASNARCFADKIRAHINPQSSNAE